MNNSYLLLFVVNTIYANEPENPNGEVLFDYDVRFVMIKNIKTITFDEKRWTQKSTDNHIYPQIHCSNKRYSKFNKPPCAYSPGFVVCNNNGLDHRNNIIWDCNYKPFGPTDNVIKVDENVVCMGQTGPHNRVRPGTCSYSILMDYEETPVVSIVNLISSKRNIMLIISTLSLVMALLIALQDEFFYRSLIDSSCVSYKQERTLNRMIHSII